MLRPVLAAVALVILAAACSSGPDVATDASDTIAPPPGIVTGSTAPQGPPDWEGDAVNPFDVHMGECINLYTWTENDTRVDLTTLVPCDSPHHREVFFETDFPAEAGAPYPGQDPIEEFARTTCYRSFEPFIGVAFEVSELEIAFSIPPEENFTDPQARYRGVVCYVYHPGGDDLDGSARGTRQ